MSLSRKLFNACAAAFVAAFSLVAASAASGNQPTDLSSIHIKNFGRVNENYYRGAQPEKRDYAALASLGVKTVVDVHRRGPKDEQQLAEAAGMRFFRIPLDENDAPTPEQVAEFLKIVNDPANQPVFVHCAGGRHRTGALTAAYRMTHDGWSADQAFEEMKQYEFMKNGDHSALKNFVFDYYKGLAQKNAAASAAKSSTANR
ncbi:MAG TPA: dual specificity protein phosphatase family protein [Blastocatellia bacterium]|jgi:protein tyrosine/serine phosphatase|nr:dual specificity protein phosphatase family protein [Blastocatellia bacterium]